MYEWAIKYNYYFTVKKCTILYFIYYTLYAPKFFSGPTVYKSAHFGEGSGYIYLDNLGCSGTEKKVLDCRYVTTVGADTHSEDVGVKCQVLIKVEGNDTTNFTGIS